MSAYWISVLLWRPENVHLRVLWCHKSVIITDKILYRWMDCWIYPVQFKTIVLCHMKHEKLNLPTVQNMAFHSLISETIRDTKNIFLNFLEFLIYIVTCGYIGCLVFLTRYQLSYFENNALYIFTKFYCYSIYLQRCNIFIEKKEKEICRYVNNSSSIVIPKNHYICTIINGRSKDETL